MNGYRTDDLVGEFDEFGLPTIAGTGKTGRNSGMMGRLRKAASKQSMTHAAFDENAGVNAPPGIEMLANSSLGDGHRYPTMDSSSRAMSMVSNGTFTDSTPVIPLLGRGGLAGIGPTNRDRNNQTQYRQRMIDRRKELLASDTGLPMPGAPSPGRPGGRTLSNLSQDPFQGFGNRAMSMSSQRGSAMSLRGGGAGNMNGNMSSPMIGRGPNGMSNGSSPGAGPDAAEEIARLKEQLDRERRQAYQMQNEHEQLLESYERVRANAGANGSRDPGASPSAPPRSPRRSQIINHPSFQDLQSQHADLQSQHRDLDARNHDLDESYRALASQFRTLQLNNQQLEESYATMQQRYDKLLAAGDDHKQLQQEHALLKQKHAEVMAREPERVVDPELEGAHRDLQQQHEELRAQHLDLLQEHEQLKAVPAHSLDPQFEQEHTQLRDQHEGLRGEHEALRDQHKTILDEHSELQNAHTALLDQHDALQQQHSAFQDKHTSLQQQLADLQASHSDLQQQHTSLRDAHTALDAQHSSLQLKNSHSSDELSASHQNLKNSLYALQAEHQKLKQEHADLQSDHAKLQNVPRGPIMTESLEELRRANEQLTAEIQVLSIELAESARRELQLPTSAKNDSAAAHLARLETELAHERTRRLQAEKHLPPAREASKDLARSHAEATQLLDMRNQEYDMLHARLLEALNAPPQSSKSLPGSPHMDLEHQYNQLSQHTNFVEKENTRLQQMLDEVSDRGPLADRLKAVEDQRDVMQEALRTLRERKDHEIRLLQDRARQLEARAERPRLTSNSSSRVFSGSRSSMSSDNSQEIGDLSYTSDTTPLEPPRMRAAPRPASPLHINFNMDLYPEQRARTEQRTSPLPLALGN